MIKAADGTMKFEAADVIPEIIDFLKDCEVKQVYFGKDHCCRCGCGGTYYDYPTNLKEIKRNLNRANKFLHKHSHECELYINPNKDGENWLNVPTVLQGESADPAGRAITIYFKGEPHF